MHKKLSGGPDDDCILDTVKRDSGSALSPQEEATKESVVPVVDSNKDQSDEAVQEVVENVQNLQLRQH